MEDGSQQVSFEFKGRFSLTGTLHKSTKSVLFVLHGQGELAKYFIQKFNILQTEEFAIIAPEGLHNYYLQGFTGRVGASWMTSENRITSIENYISFLNAMLLQVKSQVPNDAHIYILGFSQGTATASRWVAQSTFTFKKLILWGGALPPDLNKELINQRMSNKKLMYVVGDKDPYINSNKVEKLTLLAKSYGIASELKMFDGEHNIDSTVLQEVFATD